MMVLVGCGGYSIPHSLIVIEFQFADESIEGLKYLEEYFENLGFHNYGVNEGIIELKKSQPGYSESDREFNQKYILYLSNQRYLDNEKSKLSIDIFDFSTKEVRDLGFREVPKDQPSLEIRIHNNRPGGFSKKAVQFHNDLLDHLRLKFGNAEVTKPPPAENHQEYLIKTISSLITTMISWLIVYSIPASILAIVVRKSSLTSDPTRRIIYVFFCALLGTPLPFPAATILVIPLPSFFALFGGSIEYFSRIKEFALPSLVVSIIISSLLAMYIFRSHERNI